MVAWQVSGLIARPALQVFLSDYQIGLTYVSAHHVTRRKVQGGRWSRRMSRSRRRLMRLRQSGGSQSRGCVELEGNQQFPGRQPHHCPGRIMAYSVSKNLNIGMEAIVHFQKVRPLRGGHRSCQATKRPIKWQNTRPPWRTPARRCVATRGYWVLPRTKTGCSLESGRRIPLCTGRGSRLRV